MIKLYKVLALVLVAVFMLSACAPAATTTPAPEQPTAAVEQSTSAPAESTAAPAEATTAPASTGPAGVLRLPLRPGVTVGSLWTAAGRHLDEAFLSELAQVKWTADGVQPMLAESWDMEGDGTAFVFHLRQGVTWSDGEPFTADDVIYTFNIYANPKVGAIHAGKLADVVGYADVVAGTAETLAGVTKVDDYTVRVELSNPSPLFVELKVPFIS